MKIFGYITDPEGFLSGGDVNVENYIHFTDSDGMEAHGWIMVAERDLDLPTIDIDRIRKAALGVIEVQQKKEIAEHEVKMQMFDDRRQRLLAITYQPDPGESHGGASQE